MFQQRYDLKTRKRTSASVLKNHSERIPVIVECHDKSIQLPKNKFVVARTATIAHFMVEIRKYLSLNSNTAIFMFVLSKGNTHNPLITRAGDLCQDIYETHKCEDGFLYMKITLENCFGGNDECIICFEEKLLFPVCTIIKCEGYTRGLCHDCYDRNIDKINGFLKCPICSSTQIIEPDFDTEQTCCSVC